MAETNTTTKNEKKTIPRKRNGKNGNGKKNGKSSWIHSPRAHQDIGLLMVIVIVLVIGFALGTMNPLRSLRSILSSVCPVAIPYQIPQGTGISTPPFEEKTSVSDVSEKNVEEQQANADQE